MVPICQTGERPPVTSSLSEPFLHLISPALLLHLISHQAIAHRDGVMSCRIIISVMTDVYEDVQGVSMSIVVSGAAVFFLMFVVSIFHFVLQIKKTLHEETRHEQAEDLHEKQDEAHSNVGDELTPSSSGSSADPVRLDHLDPIERSHRGCCAEEELKFLWIHKLWKVLMLLVAPGSLALW